MKRGLLNVHLVYNERNRERKGKQRTCVAGGGIEKGKWGEKGGKEGKEQLDVIVDLL